MRIRILWDGDVSVEALMQFLYRSPHGGVLGDGARQVAVAPGGAGGRSLAGRPACVMDGLADRAPGRGAIPFLDAAASPSGRLRVAGEEMLSYRLHQRIG